MDCGSYIPSGIFINFGKKFPEICIPSEIINLFCNTCMCTFPFLYKRYYLFVSLHTPITHTTACDQSDNRHRMWSPMHRLTCPEKKADFPSFPPLFSSFFLRKRQVKECYSKIPCHQSCTTKE